MLLLVLAVRRLVDLLVYLERFDVVLQRQFQALSPAGVVDLSYLKQCVNVPVVLVSRQLLLLRLTFDDLRYLHKCSQSLFLLVYFVEYSFLFLQMCNCL